MTHYHLLACLSIIVGVLALAAAIALLLNWHDFYRDH